ncbi:hypothetical protein [Microbulbifer sp. HZ11]|uniref:hypothetical protein n=1 Tax=Microbulbifer sp. HZ11 TaxID=1453501 RepID=UPI0005BB10B7|nr:hypothetical protein [Microbulbifer sp. HZ11]
MISESDWKKFKKIKEAALERFCSRILKDVEDGLDSEKIDTSHGRYLYIYKLIENYDKQIGLLFNDHSRSKAVIQLMMLRGEGMVLAEELESLSAQIIEDTNPNKYA